MLRPAPAAHPAQADRTRMLEMFSREGECVPFAAPVEARGNVEVWLQRLVAGMQVGVGWYGWLGWAGGRWLNLRGCGSLLGSSSPGSVSRGHGWSMRTACNISMAS